MRLRELSLDFFGQFSGKRFDFGEGGRASDFHIIFGPNEAGKTTTMEAYLRLLYGFPQKEPYAFRHQRKNLRVSGVLDIEGKQLQLSRLPKRTPNLMDWNGTALPEQVILAHLGGLAEHDYRALLCLDDETIEAGGEDIANARGDIGRLLFSAAAGIADLSEILTEIRAEADRIYRKRASTTRMAELKHELAEIERHIRDQDVSVSAWRNLKTAAANAATAESTAREERDRLRSSLEQARAMKRALPWLEEHDRLLSEVESYADWPDRLDTDPEELVRLAKDQARLLSNHERLRQEYNAAGEEVRSIAVEPEKIALGNDLDALDELRSRMKTAELDLPRRRRQVEASTEDMNRTARELGIPEGSDPTRLALANSALIRLEAAREEMRDAESTRNTEARELDALDTQIAEAAEALDQLRDNGPEIRGIAEILGRFVQKHSPPP